MCAFGSGSKLLQAHLSNSKELFSLPAYPLLYLPELYESWQIKYKLNSEKLVEIHDYIKENKTDVRKETILPSSFW